MRAVDTDILVRLLTRDDPKQVKAAEDFIERGAWVPQIVLVEAMWVLDSVYKVQSGNIAAAIEMLLDHRTLVIQDADVVEAALGIYRGRAGIGFSDCLILEVARKAGHLPLGTFDRDLGKVEGAARI